MRQIKAKFNGKCAETGEAIPKGNNCWYDDATKKVYSLSSKKADEEMNGGGMDDAEQQAGCDNFCQSNNI